LHRRRGGRVAMFRNHAKIYCGFGERFDFVIESSANINTNPRTENTVITIDTGLAKFYKSFCDVIIKRYIAWCSEHDRTPEVILIRGGERSPCSFCETDE